MDWSTQTRQDLILELLSNRGESKDGHLSPVILTPHLLTSISESTEDLQKIMWGIATTTARHSQR